MGMRMRPVELYQLPVSFASSSNVSDERSFVALLCNSLEPSSNEMPFPAVADTDRYDTARNRNRETRQSRQEALRLEPGELLTKVSTECWLVVTPKLRSCSQVDA